MRKPSIAVATALLGWLGACSAKSGSQESPDGDLGRTGAPVACQDHPSEGAACDPLPEGLYCRTNSCAGGCENECRCQEGKWRCMVRCIDMWSPTPVDCGTPPLCRETCQWATVLPDGGIFFPTDGSYASGFTYHAYFTPTDMSTLWGDKELGIKLDLGPALETSWLQDLGNRTSLRTWPEMDEVATTNSAAAEVGRSTVTLKPNESLADRWYVVRLSPPFWLAPPLTHVAPDGSYVARFRVGSDPRVANVTFAGGAKKHRLYIAISEPVAAEVSPASIVQVGNAGGSVMCTDVEFVAGRALASLSFDCPTLTAFPETITIGAGLSSTTAVPLAPATIAKADLVLAGCGPDCESGSVR